MIKISMMTIIINDRNNDNNDNSKKTDGNSNSKIDNYAVFADDDDVGSGVGGVVVLCWW